MRASEPSQELSLSQVEHVLGEIWQKVFDLSDVRPNDSFFELDGDSMDAMLILSLVQDRFEIELPQSTLFEYSTVAKLAAAICQTEAAERAVQSLEPRRMTA